MILSSLCCQNSWLFLPLRHALPLQIVVARSLLSNEVKGKTCFPKLLLERADPAPQGSKASSAFSINFSVIAHPSGRGRGRRQVGELFLEIGLILRLDE